MSNLLIFDESIDAFNIRCIDTRTNETCVTDVETN